MWKEYQHLKFSNQIFITAWLNAIKEKEQEFSIRLHKSQYNRFDLIADKQHIFSTISI